MSRIVVIGATGHVGTYLIPRLVRAGHEVVAVSRGESEPYSPAPEWRAQAESAVVHLTSCCPAAPRRLEIACDLLFDRAPRHRAYYVFMKKITIGKRGNR